MILISKNLLAKLKNIQLVFSVSTLQLRIFRYLEISGSSIILILALTVENFQEAVL